MDYKKFIREIPDFPKPGISFKDITTLIKDPRALRYACDDLMSRFAGKPIHTVVGIESRGFIFGAVIAYQLGIGFVPVRKPGKLPAETHSVSYVLEYGTSEMHMHKDAIPKGHNVLIVDDLLATGGTARATCDLIEKVGAQVAGIGVIIELTFLSPRLKFKNYQVESLVTYDSE